MPPFFFSNPFALIIYPDERAEIFFFRKKQVIALAGPRACFLFSWSLASELLWLIVFNVMCRRTWYLRAFIWFLCYKKEEVICPKKEKKQLKAKDSSTFHCIRRKKKFGSKHVWRFFAPTYYMAIEEVIHV